MRNNTPVSETTLETTTATRTPSTDRQVNPTDVLGNGANGKTKTRVILAGFDWGTNSSCILAREQNSANLLLEQTLPTLVGYANEGIVENLLPGNQTMLFGQAAYKNRLHLRLVPPMVDGVIDDLTASRDFARHVRGLLKPEPHDELRAVIGLPANADRAARENLRHAVTGLFDKVILIPEPFLAALGYRDESRLGQDDYIDPVNNSLFVDIGGGTTDLCLIQGYYPTASDQISLAFAGDKVDHILAEEIRRTFPDVNLSMHKIREIKEAHSFVGQAEEPITVNVIVGGKMRKLTLTSQIHTACEALLKDIFTSVKDMIARTSSDSVCELMQNIVLTGGGSRIRGLDKELQRLLTEDGYEQPRVLVVGDNYKRFVAQGALKAACQTKESQWQQLIAR